MGALERRAPWKAALSTVGVFLQEERLTGDDRRAKARFVCDRQQ
jgi:hypothetical protein